MEIKNGSTAHFLKDLAENPYETVFIVGTGIIKNGWDAFNEALRRSLGIEGIEKAPIHPIAFLTFFLRFAASENKKDSDAFRERVKLLNSVREKIVETFLEYQRDNRISLDITPETDYFEKYKHGRSIMITTNWDTLLEEHYAGSKKCSVLHLHGNIRSPKGIYLPTENAVEPYRELNDRDAGFLRLSHLMAVSILEQVKRVVIWAHSLDVYDAELCSLIGSCHHGEKRDREYIIINPCYQPVDRLKCLLGGNNIDVKYLNPTS